MSILRNVIQDSVAVRQSWTGEAVTHLRTNTQFIAEYEERQDIELNAELGRDARESALLHVSDRAAAALLIQNDLLTISLYGTAYRFRVLSRTDNPGSPLVEFSLQKITAKDA